MKVWVVEIGEPLPIEPNARLMRYGRFSQYMSQNGCEVRWWTSTFSHQSRCHVVEGSCEINHDGVLLDLIGGPGYGSAISPKRLLHQSLFAKEFAKRAPEREIPDVVIGTVPSPDISRAVASFCQANGIPMILDVRDQWPDELVEVAPVGLRWLARIGLNYLFRDMRYSCRSASAISSVSKNFLEYALGFSGRERSTYDFVFPLGYDSVPRFSRDDIESAKDSWREAGIREDATVCCFFGAIGKVCDLMPVLAAARKFRSRMDIQFVICGRGVLLETFRKKAKGSDNIVWPGWVSGNEVAALMEMSSVALAPYGRNAKMQMPNKIFEYMAGSLPVVSSLQGEFARLVDEHGIGLNYRPGDTASFGSALETLVDDPERCRAMGRRGRSLLENKYAFNVVFANAIRDIRAVVTACAP